MSSYGQDPVVVQPDLRLRHRPRHFRAHKSRSPVLSSCSAARDLPRGRRGGGLSCRITSPDPLDGVNGTPTVANPYHYADNDPVNRADPLGLRACDSAMSIWREMNAARRPSRPDPYIVVSADHDIADLLSEIRQESLRSARCHSFTLDALNLLGRACLSDSEKELVARTLTSSDLIETAVDAAKEGYASGVPRNIRGVGRAAGIASIGLAAVDIVETYKCEGFTEAGQTTLKHGAGIAGAVAAGEAAAPLCAKSGRPLYIGACTFAFAVAGGILGEEAVEQFFENEESYSCTKPEGSWVYNCPYW